jgi:hypothetical protein
VPGAMSESQRSRRCACCRTGGSPRARRTTRSGCGTPATGAEAARLEGHSRSVAALCVLPDGRLARELADRLYTLCDRKKRTAPDRAALTEIRWDEALRQRRFSRAALSGLRWLT